MKNVEIGSFLRLKNKATFIMRKDGYIYNRLYKKGTIFKVVATSEYMLRMTPANELSLSNSITVYLFKDNLRFFDMFKPLLKTNRRLLR